MNKLPAIDVLESLFTADFEQGKLWWNDSPVKPRRAVAYAEAGNIDPHRQNRCVVSLFRRKHGRYRILWAMYHRVDPYPLVIDHIDRDPTNDTISNLRAVPQSENMSNRDFSSGRLPVGVRYSQRPGRRKRYSACIQINGKQKSLGYFMTADEASNAYRAAAKERLELWQLKVPKRRR